MGKETTLQWLGGAQRLGLFIILALITTLVVIINVSPRTIELGIAVDGGSIYVLNALFAGIWLMFLIGTYVHWRVLKKKGYIID